LVCIICFYWSSYITYFYLYVQNLGVVVKESQQTVEDGEEESEVTDEARTGK